VLIAADILQPKVLLRYDIEIPLHEALIEAP
jgi:hypothetical protein